MGGLNYPLAGVSFNKGGSFALQCVCECVVYSCNQGAAGDVESGWISSSSASEVFNMAHATGSRTHHAHQRTNTHCH